MLKIATEFLDKLVIASKTPLGLAAYLALIVVFFYFFYKNRQLVTLRKLTEGLDIEDRRKTVEQKFNTQIDPNTSPKEWLEHKKIRYKLIAFLASIGIVFGIFAMAYQVKLKNVTGNVIAERGENFLVKRNLMIEEQAKKVIGNYLQSLTDETFRGDDFFANDVEQFFNKEHTTPNQIENYIKTSYYPKYLKRKIYTKISTWQLIEKKKNYCIFTLELVGSWVDGETKKVQASTSKMKLKINNQYKIVYWNEIRR